MIKEFPHLTNKEEQIQQEREKLVKTFGIEGLHELASLVNQEIKSS